MTLNIQYIFVCRKINSTFHAPCHVQRALCFNLMVNNSPISLLAGLLDFSLNSLACLALRTEIYKSFSHQIGSRAKTATSPRIPCGGHYSKLFIQLRRWAEWENDFDIAEREQLQLSAVGGWQISSSLFLSLSLILSLLLLLLFNFCLNILFFFHFTFSFSWFSLSRRPYFSLLPALSHSLFIPNVFLPLYAHSYTQGNSTLEIHSQEH